MFYEHVFQTVCSPCTLSSIYGLIVVINVFFVKVLLQMLLDEKMHERGLCIHSCGRGFTVAFVSVLAIASEVSRCPVQLPCCVTPTMLFFVPRGAGSDWHRGIPKE